MVDYLEKAHSEFLTCCNISHNMSLTGQSTGQCLWLTTDQLKLKQTIHLMSLMMEENIIYAYMQISQSEQQFF